MVWLHIAAMSPPCHHRVTTVSPPCHHRVTTVSPPCHHRITTVSPPCHQESLYSLRTVLQGGPNIEQQIHKSMHKAMTHKKQKTTVHECQGNSHGRYLKKNKQRPWASVSFSQSWKKPQRKQTTTLGKPQGNSHGRDHNPGRASEKQSWGRSTKNKQQPREGIRETAISDKLEYIITTWYASFSI